MLGREVARLAAPVPGEVALPLAGVAPGVYVVRVVAGTQVATQTVVVR